MGVEGIGARVLRKEDKRFITGKGRYTDDFKMAGMHYAAFVRSPHAYAQIKKIDKSKAEKMPGVVAVLDGKQIKGDGRTPEGNYYIDRKNPNSQFYLSVGISYPNAEDRAYAKSIGKSPGGDIFIHGKPVKYKNDGRDWTAGCISISNAEMRDVYAMIRTGTPISIFP